MAKTRKGADFTGRVESVLTELLAPMAKADQLANELDGKNITFKVNVDGADKLEEVNENVKDLLSNLTSLSNYKSRMKFFQSFENATEDIKKNWNDLIKLIKSTDIDKSKGIEGLFENKDIKTAALNVYKYANAFTALGGNVESVSTEISEFVKQISELQNKNGQKVYSASAGYLYDVDSFKQIFDILNKIKSLGSNFIEGDIFEQLGLKIGNFEPVQNTIKVLTDKVLEYGSTQRQIGNIIVDSYEEQEKSIESTTDAIQKLNKEQIKNQALSKYQKPDIYSDYDVDYWFDESLPGIQKYSQALESLKSEQESALNSARYFQNQYADSFDSNDIEKQEQAYSSMIRYMEEYAIKTKEVEYVQEKLNEAIRNYDPSNIAETNNTEQWIVLITLLKEAAEKIKTLGEAIGEVGGESNFKPLLSSIEDIKNAFSELTQEIINLQDSISKINISNVFNVDNSGSGAKAQLKIDEYLNQTLKAYEREYQKFFSGKDLTSDLLFSSLAGSRNIMNMIGSGNLSQGYFEDLYGQAAISKIQDPKNKIERIIEFLKYVDITLKEEEDAIGSSWDELRSINKTVKRTREKGNFVASLNKTIRDAQKEEEKLASQEAAEAAGMTPEEYEKNIDPLMKIASILEQINNLLTDIADNTITLKVDFDGVEELKKDLISISELLNKTINETIPSNKGQNVDISDLFNLGELQKEATDVGEDTAQGLNKGIEESVSETKKSGEELGESVIEGVTETLDIHSPSKVMERLGVFTAEGFLEGFKGSFEEVSQEIVNDILEMLNNGENGIIAWKNEIKNLKVNDVSKENPLKNALLGVIENSKDSLFGDLFSKQNTRIEEIIKSRATLFEEPSGQLSFFDGIIEQEKEVQQEVKETNEQIEGQISLFDSPTSNNELLTKKEAISKLREELNLTQKAANDLINENFEKVGNKFNITSDKLDKLINDRLNGKEPIKLFEEDSGQLAFIKGLKEEEQKLQEEVKETTDQIEGQLTIFDIKKPIKLYEEDSGQLAFIDGIKEKEQELRDEIKDTNSQIEGQLTIFDIKKPIKLYEEESGQLAFVDGLIEKEKEFNQEVEETNTDIKGQLSLFDSFGADNNGILNKKNAIIKLREELGLSQKAANDFINTNFEKVGNKFNIIINKLDELIEKERSNKEALELFEEDSGQLAFIDGIIEKEKKLQEKTKETTEQIEGQLSIFDMEKSFNLFKEDSGQLAFIDGLTEKEEEFKQEVKETNDQLEGQMSLFGNSSSNENIVSKKDAIKKVREELDLSQKEADEFININFEKVGNKFNILIWKLEELINKQKELNANSTDFTLVDTPGTDFTLVEDKIEESAEKTTASVKKETKAMEDIAPAAQKGSKAKKDLAKSNKELADTALATTSEIQSEIKEMNELSTVDVDKNSSTWEKLYDTIHKYGIELGEIVSIQEIFNAKTNEHSFKIKDINGSIFNVSDDFEVTRVTRIVEVKKAYDDATKSINAMYKAKKKLALGDNTSKTQLELKDAEDKLADAVERINIFRQNGIDLQEESIKLEEKKQALERSIAEELDNINKNSSDKAFSILQENIEKATKIFNSSEYTNNNNFKDQLKNLISQVDTIEPGDIDRINELNTAISDLLKGDTAKDAKSGLLNKLSELRKRVADTVSKNTNMTDELRSKYMAIGKEIDDIFSQDVTKYTRDSVRKLRVSLDELDVKMKETGQSGASMWTRIGNRLTDMNSKLIAQYLSWQDWIRYVRGAFNTIRELDTALVDLRKTTTMTNEELSEFYYNADDIAKEVGVTTQEIISQAAAWSRLGYSSKEAATEMAALSSQFAQISPGMNVETATDGLVSSMKAFGFEVDEVERNVMDNINRIGNTMATTNEEIVQMLERSSAAMSAANNSIEETIALESAAVQVTRNAETTGTAFRTISMRIRGYDEETEELSEEYENLSGKIADLTKTAKSPGGISLFSDKDKTTFKSTYQLLKDISEIWDELTDKEQAQLTEKLAGKRGGQVLSAIMNDFGEVEKAMTEMSNAAGSSDQEMEIIKDSIDYKLNAIKESWRGFLMDTLDREDIKKLFDALINGSESLQKTLTTLTPVISPLIEALAKLINIIADLNEKTGGLAGIAGLLYGGVKVKGKVSDIGGLFSGLLGGKGLNEKSILSGKNLIKFLKTPVKDAFGKAAKSGVKNAADVIIDNSDDITDAVIDAFDIDDYKDEIWQNALSEQSSLAAEVGVENFGEATELLTQSTVPAGDALGKMATAEMEAGGAAKGAALSMGALLGIIAAIGVAIYAGVKAWDYFTTTVKEVEEEITQTKSKIEELKSEIDTLNSMDDRNEYQNNRLKALKRELEIQKDLLEIEEKRRIAEKYGTKFSDSFDEDNANVRIRKLSTGQDSSDKMFGLNNIASTWIANYISKESEAFYKNSVGVYDNIPNQIAKTLFDDVNKMMGSAKSTIRDFENKKIALDNINNGLSDKQDQLFKENDKEKPNELKIQKLTEEIHELENHQSELKQEYELSLLDVQQLFDQSIIEAEQIKQEKGKDSSQYKYYKTLIDTLNKYLVEEKKENGTYNFFESYDFSEAIKNDEEALEKLINSEDANLDIKSELKKQYPDLLKLMDKEGITLDELIKKYRKLDEVEEQAGKPRHKLSVKELFALSDKDSDIENEIADLKRQYAEEWNKVQDLGINVQDTVFGNIDLNNRNILTWTDSVMEEYKDILQSWEEDAVYDWEGFKKELDGTISTVYGGSNNYNGVEIAFSPMLQKSDGTAELLSRDVVDKYIYSILEAANEDLSKENLLRLDTIGLEIDGKKIQGLLADVGETAIQTGEAMHYLGSEGSLQLIVDEINELEKQSKGINKIKTDLIGMAQSGKLDESTLKSYERFNELIEALGYSADVSDDVIKQLVEDINALAVDNPVDDLNDFGTAIDKLGEAYKAFSEGNRITAAQLSEIQTQFGFLGDAYQQFENDVLSGNTDLQSSFNQLVTAYAQKTDMLNQLNESNKDYYISELKSKGITNADAVVNKYLADVQEYRKNVEDDLIACNAVLNDSQDDLFISAQELENATYEQVNALIEEAEKSGVTAEALKVLAVQKELVAKISLYNTGDIEYCLNLAKAAGIAGKEMQVLSDAKDNYESAKSRLKSARENNKGRSDLAVYGLEQDVQDARKAFENASNEAIDAVQNWKPVELDLGVNLNYDYNTSDAAKSAEKSAKDTAETFDWLETKIQRCEESIQRLDKTVSASYKSWSKRNGAIASELDKVREKISLQATAYQAYMQKANSIGLSEHYKNLVKNGAIKIEDIADENLKKQINDFKTL